MIRKKKFTKEADQKGIWLYLLISLSIGLFTIICSGFMSNQKAQAQGAPFSNESWFSDSLYNPAFSTYYNPDYNPSLYSTPAFGSFGSSLFHGSNSFSQTSFPWSTGSAYGGLYSGNELYTGGGLYPGAGSYTNSWGGIGNDFFFPGSNLFPVGNSLSWLLDPYIPPIFPGSWMPSPLIPSWPWPITPFPGGSIFPWPIPGGGSTAPSSPVQSEEYIIYSALINSRYEGANKVSIRNHTSKWELSNPSYLFEHFEGILQETINDYTAKNAREYSLSRSFNLDFAYELVGDEKTYSAIELSRVGFNAQRTQALVYTSYTSAPLAGSGSYYFFEKVNGAWILVDGAMAWIS